MRRSFILVLVWVVFPRVVGGASGALQEARERLKRAGEAYRGADYKGCARLAAGLSASGLRNPDAALFIEAQCLFYAGEYGQSQKRFKRLARRYPDSPHARLAIWRMADCSWELGQWARATDAYKRADAGRAEPRADPAVGLARRALRLLDAGRNLRGRALWISLRRRFPAHPLTTAAPPGHEEPRLGLSDALAVARSLHQARMWEQALYVLDVAPEPRRSRDKYEMAYLAGRILFDMRFRYEQAAEMLLAARDHAPDRKRAEDAWFYASRSLGRAGRDDDAIASHLDMVKRYPKGEYADRALLYAGWLEQNQDRCERALPIFARVAKEYPKGRWADEAKWFTAWCHISSKQWEKAVAALEPQLSRPGFRFGGRARYWTGVAQSELGKSEQATGSFKRVIANYPLTWYSRLARIRLGDSAPPEPSPLAAANPVRVKDRLLSRAGELTDAGLPGLAALLLRKEEKRFLARHPGRAGRLALMEAFRHAGDFHRPWYLSLVRERSALRALPTANTREIWKHAYPPYERELLRKNAGGDEQLVLFLQAIMRTESGFDPGALSVADARGLMQMIPPTAVRVARLLALTNYSDDALFDPETNIRTAAWYIGRLVTKFKRQWPVAAASYNGGPPPVMDWCKKNGRLSVDAFVEAIPYTESRRYAKRVFTAFARYAWLEGEPLPELKLTLDPDYLDAEPNF